MDNTQFIKVWDIAIRVFHWTLLGCYVIAFISSENIMKVHVIFGYIVLFLVLFRILYGFVGTKYARFSNFLYPPAQIVDYLKGLLIGRPKHYIGHNPAGGFMIVILLLSLLSLTLTGLKAYGVKGHGPLAKHEISFMTMLLPIVMIKRIMMNTTAANGTAKKIIGMRKMNFGKRFMRRSPILLSF